MARVASGQPSQSKKIGVPPMKDEPSLSDGENRALKPGQVLLTRRRWDAYFLPPIVTVTLISVLAFWFSSNTATLKAPGPLISLWILFRWLWPGRE
jgi:hypothetical protein